MSEAEAAPLGAKLVSEFLGTYILVLTVGLNVLGKSPAGAFSIAASLMSMIYALGDVSGANFNPAVTLAILVFDSTTMPVKKAASYVIVQIVGGIAAAFTYVAIYSGQSVPLGPGSGYNLGQAAVAEIIFTMVLCLVVLCVAVSSTTHDGTMFGFAIGSCIIVGGFAIGGISGGSFNPAVSFGLGVSSMSILNAVWYSCFELVGALVAALIAKITLVEILEAREEPLRMSELSQSF